MSWIAGASTMNDGEPLDELELGAGEGVRDRELDDAYGDVGVGGSWRCFESLVGLWGCKGSVGGRLEYGLPGERFGDGVGDGSYIGGGTKLAITRRLFPNLPSPPSDDPWSAPPTLPLPSPPLPEDASPASIAACKSAAYRSWKVRRWLISMATARSSAAIRLRDGLMGCERGSSPQITRARSCWCSGIRSWIGVTLRDHIWRKEMKAGGQFSGERSSCSADLDERGKGTEGGVVVDRRAAKYKHNAGPRITVVDRHVCPWRFGKRTCDHDICLRAAQQLRVQQSFRFRLRQRGFEVAMKSISNLFFCQSPRVDCCRYWHGR